MLYQYMYRIKPIILSLSIVLPFSGYAIAPENPDEENNIPMEDVQRFSNAIAQIKQYYVNPVKDKELFDDAIRGMLSGLDPHSSYLDENDFADLQTTTSGEFGGLGIEVTVEEGIIKIITPLAGSPAEKAKLKSGDYIIKIGHKSVQGMDLRDAVNMMRGKVGEPIVLTILRKGETKPLIFNLVREKIQVQSVQAKLLDQQYGYIRLTQFQATTAKDMLTHIDELKQKAGGQLNGLVLDLRNNPGGLLDSAVQISDAFLDTKPENKQELIVYTEGRLPGSKFTAVATPGDVLNNAPIVVLINGGSASASEIVAGALKDNKRAVIVGTRSFGKGSVQTVLPLDSQRAIKLTTALYYTPSGTSIQAQGITPDIAIEEIAVPKLIENKNSFKGFSEADLNGHLSNGNKNSVMAQKKSTQDEDTLLHEDYQLYAAPTILKSLIIAKQ